MRTPELLSDALAAVEAIQPRLDAGLGLALAEACSAAYDDLSGC